MSNSRPITAGSSSSNFQLIFDNALKVYEKRTKKDLLAHPLAAELQYCDSPTKILAVLHRQVQGLDQSLSSDDRWTKWLDPTVNVLYMLSETLGEGISLVFSPGKVIFAGVGVLLSAAKDIRKSHETLMDIFGRIESFFRRLEIYTQVPSTTEMLDTIIQVMVEVLTILGVATKEITQGRIKKYAKRLIGKTDMEDALKNLDRLTQEESRMAIAENLRTTKQVERLSSPNLVDIGYGALCIISERQLRESIHKWLSSQDPSTNHNIACETHHKKTATWFFQGNIYQEWKSKGSLLWIYGKPGSGKSILCSTVIEDIKALCETGQASMAYFYFDFRNANKQSLRDLLPSLLTQLSARSNPRFGILSALYSAHDDGKNQPSDSALTKCLQDMLSLPDQHPIYLIMDALDESPISSGIPSPRERRWKKEDKEIVVKTLSERADGMFRWTFCQLEVLRDCLPSSVRHFLEELPESLDETYERVLREIKKPNRDHARRLLECLVVAIRPLRVEELAEVLAIDFNDAEGIPKLNASWRWEDQERALLTSCSSLIAIVDTGASRVVQFSHFSVKEYLTSERLATSGQDVSRYHITFATAHTNLAQVCVSVLLQLDDHDEQDDVEKMAPLAVYAAEYWAIFCGLARVARHRCPTSLRISLWSLRQSWESGSSMPLYYAALCGFANVVEELIVKHPQHVNATGGYYKTPAVAALAGRHFELAHLLHRNKSSLEPRGCCEITPLHSAAYHGDLEMVQVLLECGVDVNAQNRNGQTPLDFALYRFHHNEVALLSIAQGADPNTRNTKGFTPAESGRIEIARLLIEHGANVEVKDEERNIISTEVESGKQLNETINLLLELLAK
ncbi:hypothetical protein BGY98DRAFT_1178154 [Russula aff. rugulosa BPL654]|nr:hypothetical protein BGY98DRAFT_1178154 [Russula aff. rugulosa BPL654]